MCRMILSLGMDRTIFEIGRREWMSNPHGWGMIFKYGREWVEWHTVNSDVPMPTSYLPFKVDGIWHIRFATVNVKMGGIHPFTMPDGKRQIFYAHNGVIYPHTKGDIDSEIIGEYLKDGKGNLKDKMLGVLEKLRDGHYGTWNIISLTSDDSEAFAYCDGSLVKVFNENGDIIGFTSDEDPLKYMNYKYKEMRSGDWVYLIKENGKWIIAEEGNFSKRVYDKFGHRGYYGFYERFYPNVGWF